MSRLLFRLSCLVFALASTLSHAVEFAKDEPAEVLLFPFFTTEKGWDTYINLVSPVGGQDAFKVRILDGVSGEPVKSFNVYLSSNENWRASISRREEGGSRLQVAEGSCLVEEDLSIGGSGTVIDIPNRVGMIEVYAMGYYPITGSGACDELADNWKPGGEWEIQPVVNEEPENRRMVGELYLINVTEGLAATYVPAGLSALRDELEHSPPGSSSPSLAEAEPVALIYGSLVEPASGEGIDAVAMVLARGKPYLLNDVITAPEINARTDWVISYPLSRYKHYKPAQVVVDGEEKWCESFGGHIAELGDPVAQALANPQHDVALWAQGERIEFVDWQPSPTFDAKATLCHAVNVVPFGEQEPVLVENGSAYLSPEPSLMQESLDPDITSVVLRWGPFPLEYPEESGIYRPALGFRMTVFENGFLDGGSTLANYAVLRNHQRRD